MTISMTPGELEANATAITGAAGQFEGEFNRIKTKVTSATWEGAAAAAFQECFSDAHVHFTQMLTEINQVADLLRRAKDGLSQADQDIARGMAAG